MKVLVLKTFKARETGKVVQPGQHLEYPESRATELAAGGWVKIVGDSKEADTEPSAEVSIPDDGTPDVVDDTNELAPAEKVESTVMQPEKEEVDETAVKAKRDRKAKSER